MEQHLDEARIEVENALKMTFATSAQSFTNVVFNSRDFFFTPRGAILHFGDFVNLSTVGNILPILTLTTVETRSDEDGTYGTRTEGSNDDYTIDLLRNSIRFTHGDVHVNGYQNIRITGTYGLVASPMTSLGEKYKNYIGLVAALKGLRYSTGSSHNEAKTVNVGGISVSKDEFSQVSSQNYTKLQEALEQHLETYGLSRKRRMVAIR